jgi:hypothetical protein
MSHNLNLGEAYFFHLLQVLVLRNGTTQKPSIPILRSGDSMHYLRYWGDQEIFERE